MTETDERRSRLARRVTTYGSARWADAAEVRKAGLYDTIWQAFAVLLPPICLYFLLAAPALLVLAGPAAALIAALLVGGEEALEGDDRAARGELGVRGDVRRARACASQSTSAPQPPSYAVEKRVYAAATHAITPTDTSAAA